MQKLQLQNILNLKACHFFKLFFSHCKHQHVIQLVSAVTQKNLLFVLVVKEKTSLC